MVDSNANALEVNRFQQLCRLCASDTRSQTNGNGFDCKNSLNLIQTIKHLYGVQIRCDDKISTIICSNCLDEVFHFESHYKKVQMAQLQFAKYQLMIKSMTDIITIGDEDDIADDDRVTSTASASNQLEYFCANAEKQNISSQSIVKRSSNAQSVNINDWIEVRRFANAESTVITIGKPYDDRAKFTQGDHCSQNFGTMTVTTIPMTSASKMTKRPLDVSIDLDKNSQNVPANDQHPRKIPKTSIGTSTADAASIAEQVPIKRPSTTNSNVQYQAAISDELDPSKQRVSSSNTISIEQRESESGSSPKAQLEDELGGSMAGIRVRDLRSMQS